MGPWKKPQGLSHHPNSLTASLSVICLFVDIFHPRALVLTVCCWLWCVRGDGPFTGVWWWWARGWACLAMGCHTRPHARCHCCGSGYQRPAAGTRQGVAMLGVAMGAVTVITVRNKNASVEEKRKCLDLPSCLKIWVTASRAAVAQRVSTPCRFVRVKRLKRFWVSFHEEQGSISVPHLMMLEFWFVIW